jgi:hypothetical protein
LRGRSEAACCQQRTKITYGNIFGHQPLIFSEN